MSTSHESYAQKNEVYFDVNSQSEGETMIKEEGKNTDRQQQSHQIEGGWQHDSNDATINGLDTDANVNSTEDHLPVGRDVSLDQSANATVAANHNPEQSIDDDVKSGSSTPPEGLTIQQDGDTSSSYRQVKTRHTVQPVSATDIGYDRRVEDTESEDKQSLDQWLDAADVVQGKADSEGLAAHDDEDKMPNKSKDNNHGKMNDEQKPLLDPEEMLLILQAGKNKPNKKIVNTEEDSNKSEKPVEGSQEKEKIVSFQINEKDGNEKESSSDKKTPVKMRTGSRQNQARRSSAEVVLLRHRKVTRHVSSAEWDVKTRNFPIRKLSDSNIDLTSKKKGDFAGYKTTQVSPVFGLKQGRSIQVDGHLQRKSLSFSINFQSGAGRMPYADVRTVLFMMNPLLKEKRIVCNSFIYGDWGPEEVWDVDRLRNESEFEDFPFTAGAKFSITLTVHRDYYSVFVSNRHLLDYHHRLGIELISHIRLEGDCYYSNIECPLALELPYIHEIPGGLRPGHIIILDTFIWRRCKSFEIQISARHQDVYALFDTHTTFNGEISHFLCKAFLNGDKSENVLIDGHLPLHRDQAMVLKFLANSRLFRVYVNDQHFADYEHKLPLDKLTQITVSGDISLYGLQVKRPGSSGFGALRRVSRCCECNIL